MDAQAQAKEWIESSQDELGGYSPTNVAAAALYAASLVDPKANLSIGCSRGDGDIVKTTKRTLYTTLRALKWEKPPRKPAVIPQTPRPLKRAQRLSVKRTSEQFHHGGDI